MPRLEAVAAECQILRATLDLQPFCTGSCIMRCQSQNLIAVLRGKCQNILSCSSFYVIVIVVFYNVLRQFSLEFSKFSGRDSVTVPCWCVKLVQSSGKSEVVFHSCSLLFFSPYVYITREWRLKRDQNWTTVHAFRSSDHSLKAISGQLPEKVSQKDSILSFRI